jgi:hypothetical protein
LYSALQQRRTQGKTPCALGVNVWEFHAVSPAHTSENRTTVVPLGVTPGPAIIGVRDKSLKSKAE